MKKFIIAGLILIFALGYAADTYITQGSETQTGTFYAAWTEVKDYDNHIYAIFRVTSTPPTLGKVDSIDVILQTLRFRKTLTGDYANTAPDWVDLYTMSTGVDDTTTLSKWFLADSLAGVYSLGEYLRFEVVLTDTITLDTTYTDNPWTWTAVIGFQ